MKNEVAIQMLTPLWTGGVTGNSDRIHETGIIGSMRWWYEAIVRGFGGFVCDPTTGNHCELSGQEKSDGERRKKLCPVGWLFGCGGWKRRFRIEAFATTTEQFYLASLDKAGQFNNWWLSHVFEKNLSDILVSGTVTLNFQPMKNYEEETLYQIEALLSVMSHLGAIGAKAQYGFGQFEWTEKVSLKDALQMIHSFITQHEFMTGKKDNPEWGNPEWYDFKRFWFYELCLPNGNDQVKKFETAHLIGSSHRQSTYLPVSFDIRYKLPYDNFSGLRQVYRQNHSKEQTRKVFGTLKGSEKRGSRIFVSHLFKRKPSDNEHHLRVWGFTEGSIAKAVGEELRKIFNLQAVPAIYGEDLIQQVKQGGNACSTINLPTYP